MYKNYEIQIKNFEKNAHFCKLLIIVIRIFFDYLKKKLIYNIHLLTVNLRTCPFNFHPFYQVFF